MVTYFNRKDLVSFGSYLMSEKRKSRLRKSYNEAIIKGLDNPLPIEDAQKLITHSDIEYWLEDNRFK